MATKKATDYMSFVQLFGVGDIVDVESSPNSIYTHDFRGIIQEINKEFALVRDQDDDVWSADFDHISVEDDDYCPESEDGKHEPDWATVSIADDGDTYIDVLCLNCGQSGCVGSSKTLAEGISW